MAIATVSPYVLMQELARARARGGPSDYYGLGAAIRGVGNDFDASTRSVGNINEAVTNNAQTNARMDVGYYPAQVAEQMAGIRNRTYDLDQHMAMSKAIEDAHQAVTAQGLRSGTPEYDQAMNVYLSQHGGYNAATSSIKAAQQASTTLQNKAFAQMFVKKSVENELAKRIAQDYFNKKSGEGLMSMSPEDRQALAKDAMAHAKKTMLDNDVNVQVDHDGNISATDKAGNVVPIEPQVFAAAVSAMGNKVPMDVLQHLGVDYQKELAQQMKQTQPTPAAKTTKGGVDLSDMRSMQFDELKYLRSEQVKLAGKENLSDEGKKLYADHAARIKELQDSLYGTKESTNQITTQPQKPTWVPPNDFDPPSIINQVPPNDFSDLYGGDETPPAAFPAPMATVPSMFNRLANMPALSPSPPGTLYGDRQQSTTENPDPYTLAIQAALPVRPYNPAVGPVPNEATRAPPWLNWWRQQRRDFYGVQ